MSACPLILQERKKMKLKKGNKIKEIAVGYSWTTALCGVLVPIFRGHLEGVLEIIGLYVIFIISGKLLFDSYLIFNVSFIMANFCYAFFVNKEYYNFLKRMGYRKIDE